MQRLLTFAVGLVLGSVWLQTSPGANLRVVADNNNALAISDAGACGTTGPATPLANILLKVNSSNQLVTCGAGGGDVVGPASSTDNAIARFDSTTGKLLQDSGVTIGDTGLIVAPAVNHTFGGMRVNGGDTSNTIYNGPADIGITVDTGGSGQAGVTVDYTAADNVTAIIGHTTGTRQLRISSGAPAVSSTSANSCGTSAPAIAGSDSVGTVTVGATSGTNCTVTFSYTAPTMWICEITDTTTAVLARAVPKTTTTVEFQGVFTAADVITYHCFAR